MKIALKYVLIVMLTVLILDRMFSYVGQKLMQHSPNRFAQLYFGRIESDVVVLGNSRADRHFDPKWLYEHTRLKLVNLGIGGNHMQLNAILFEDYLKYQKTPSVVIVEVSSLVVEPNTMGDFLLFAPYSDGLSSYMLLEEAELYWVGKIFSSLQFNNDMFLRVLKDIVRMKPQRYLGGRLSQVAASTYTSNMKIYQKNIEGLHRIIELCELNDIKAVFVLAPFAVPKQQLQNFDEWKRTVDQAIFPYKLLDDSFLYSDVSLFNDPQHLNKAGSESWQEHLFYELLRWRKLDSRSNAS